LIVLGVSAVIGAILLLSIGLAIVELRRITPLAFRCIRCGAKFQQPPHQDYPHKCPSCRARDWAV